MRQTKGRRPSMKSWSSTTESRTGGQSVCPLRLPVEDLSALGITVMERRRAIRNTTEAVGKSFRQLWIRRGEA